MRVLLRCIKTKDDKRRAIMSFVVNVILQMYHSSLDDLPILGSSQNASSLIKHYSVKVELALMQIVDTAEYSYLPDSLLGSLMQQLDPLPDHEIAL